MKSSDNPKNQTGSISPSKGAAPKDAGVSTSAWFEESPEISDSEELHKLPMSEGSPTIAGTDKASQQSPPLAELDISLPNVCEALVLVTQCIITVTLEVADEMKQDAENLRGLFNGAKSENGQGLVESLIGA